MEWEKTDKQKTYIIGSLNSGPGVDGTKSHNGISVITLNRLGLIAPAFTEFDTYDPPDPYDWKDRSGPVRETVRVHGDLEIVTITPFGEAFYKAVIS